MSNDIFARSTTVVDAMLFAKRVHEGQERKYTGEPYIVHPFAVAGLVTSVTEDASMVMAALLHDTVEDTPTTSQQIEMHFGTRVRKLVVDLTDVSKKVDGNRKTRVALDRAHTATASSDAKTIKLADLIDNLKAIETFDVQFAKKYMAEKRLLLEVLTEGNSKLFGIVSSLIDNYFEKNPQV